MIRICSNNHITGYKTCPLCGASTEPEKFVIKTENDPKDLQTLKHLRSIGKV